MSPDSFERSRLSAREDAILEAAIEGLTDIQIALRLDITPSTVNSYWVRIRGKLGQLSRTELVALALKQKAVDEMSRASAEIAELREVAQAHSRMSADFAHAEIYRAALDALPEAVLVCCSKGLIRYCNARLEAMFGYGAGELTDLPVAILVPHAMREREGHKVLEYMKDPHPLRLGLGTVIYGQRKSGDQFRIVLLLDARPTSTGPVATCVVRDFGAEIEFRRERTAGWE